MIDKPASFHFAIVLLALFALVSCRPSEPPAPKASGEAAQARELPERAATSGAPPSLFKSTEVSGIDYGRGLVLADDAGQPRRLEDFKGSVALVFFGFANCPDICPTTLARLAQTRKAMGEDAREVQVLFVTLDPERDTPEKLRAYVDQFDSSFIALRPRPEQLDEVQRSFRVIAKKMPMPDTDSYMVDHSSVIYAYDRSNALRLIVSPGFGVRDLAADLTRLVRG